MHLTTLRQPGLKPTLTRLTLHTPRPRLPPNRPLLLLLQPPNHALPPLPHPLIILSVPLLVLLQPVPIRLDPLLAKNNPLLLRRHHPRKLDPLPVERPQQLQDLSNPGKVTPFLGRVEHSRVPTDGAAGQDQDPVAAPAAVVRLRFRGLLGEADDDERALELGEVDPEAAAVVAADVVVQKGGVLRGLAWRDDVGSHLVCKS